MLIRTGKQLLQSLRDGLQLFIDGDRVEDVTTDPRFTATAQSLAQLSDMQHGPSLIDRYSIAPQTGVAGQCWDQS